MSAESELEIFDLEQVYDEKINPLMAQIIAICKEHNMPFLATFVYEIDEEEGPGLCTSMLLPQNRTPEQLEGAYREVRRRDYSFMAMTITKGETGNE